MKNGIKIALLAIVTMIAGVFAAGTANATTYDLKATTGSVTMPDGAPIHIWGFASCNGAVCGAAQLPGPILEVTDGILTVNLENGLTVPVSFMVPGQRVEAITDQSAAVKPSYVVTVAPGATRTYTINNLNEGTYLYQSGTDEAKQVQMGLYGAVVVRPVGYNAAAASHTAYAGTAAPTTYNREGILLLSDIDPSWHSSVQANAPYNANYFNPKYWLINGKAYPDTSAIYAKQGDTVLLRYLNAGSTDHVMVGQGLVQTRIADDGFPVPQQRETYAVTLNPGQTQDVLVTPNAIGQFPIYDRQLDVDNWGQFPGGMITMLRTLDPLSTGLVSLNSAPTLVNQGQTYVYDLELLDASNLDGTHTYSLIPIPNPPNPDIPVPTGVTIDPATGRISWDPNQVFGGLTDLLVQVVVSDGATVLSTNTFGVTLNLDVNQHPVFTAGTLSNATVLAGDVFSKTIVATDPDVVDTVTYSLIDQPAGMTIDPTTGVITWTSSSSTGGTYSVPVQVHIRDGRGGANLGVFDLTVTGTAVAPPPAGPPGTNPVQLIVLEEGTGTPIPNFKYLITVDNAHKVNPQTQTCSPACPSEEIFSSDTPVVRSGTIPDPITGNTVLLPDGDFYVQVLTTPLDGAGNPVTGQAALDGGRHRMDGIGFKAGPGGVTSVTVGVHKNPIPVARIAVQIFTDTAPLNGAWDRITEPAPSRNGVVDPFKIVISDEYGGLVSEDVHGNPICSQYDAGGNVIPGTGGTCYSGDTGFLLIDNIAPGKYAVEAVPLPGTGWIQTTTIEGSKINDAFTHAGSQGIYPIETAGMIYHGFVQQCDMGTCNPGDTTGTGRFFGHVNKVEAAQPPFNLPDGAVTPVDRPWLALNDLSGSNQTVAVVRGDENGNFEFTNVPNGTYQVVVFDDGLDYIMAIYTASMPKVTRDPATNVFTVETDVQVYDPRFETSPTVAGRPLPIPDWWGQLHGTVFYDENENGIQDAGEEGIPGEAVDVVRRDGSGLYGTVTDEKGEYHFRRFFPFGHWMVPAVGYARLGATGAHIKAGTGLPLLGRALADERVDHGPVLTLNNFVLEGASIEINWGKKAYPLVGNPSVGNDYTALNGGISGVVWYGTTRNAFDASNAAADPWEPGIPRVTVNLYEPILNPVTGLLETDPVTGEARKGRILGTVQTDSFTDSRPTNCPILDPNGAPTVDPNCQEVLRTWAQVQPGVFDGGYQFFENCRNDTVPGDPNALYAQDSGLCSPLAPGKYLTEVVVPDNYKLVTANDINVINAGDTWGPNGNGPAPVAPLLNPAGCVGPERLVTLVDSPFFGQTRNDCNLKVATLTNGNNAGADFHLFTEVPLPARIKGFVNDNLNLETTPGVPQFGDKSGVPYVPVSIKDFSGKEVARVYTDQNGFFEALVPTNQRVNVPSPTGLGPNTLLVRANDRGPIDNPDPNFNPNYNTLLMVFQFYPGGANFADMALTPINGFLAHQNITCEAGTVPSLHGVDTPRGTVADSITLTGTSFGSATGVVTLDGTPLTTTSWSDTQIVVSLAGAPEGAGQLIVTDANNTEAINGITIHVTGAIYNPNFVTVTTTIQAAVDAAPAGSVVLVPGVVGNPTIYRENVIVYKGITLQGFGSEATVIDGAFLDPVVDPSWGNTLSAITASGLVDLAAEQPVTALFSTITVLGKNGGANGVHVDGLTIQGGRLGGGIHVNTFADNTIISNNKVENNFGRYSGGIGLGFPRLNDNFIANPWIHHNRVLHNGTLVRAGGIGVYNGVSDYRINDNLICANGTTSAGGGIAIINTNTGALGSIESNDILFNWSFTDAGGVLVKGPVPAAIGAASAGTGPVQISGNLLQGNFSNEDGAALDIEQAANGPVRVENNIIVNNLAGAQGAIKIQDSFETVLINNTVAKNISTSTAGTLLLDNGPHSAGLVVYPNTRPFQVGGQPGHSDPALFNNVFWANNAYTWSDATETLSLQGAYDLSLYLGFGVLSEVSNNMFSAQVLATLPVSSGATNQIGVDPQFVNSYDNTMTAVAIRAAGEVAINPLQVPVVIHFSPLAPTGDYHVVTNSQALQYGESSFSGGTVSAPGVDFDGNARPIDGCFDAGADERVAGPGVTNTCSTGGAGMPTVSGAEGAPVAFDASALAGTTFAWSFGDGGTANGQIVNHTYANSGSYAVFLTIDGGTPLQSVANIANIAPVADAGPDLTSTTGLPVTLVGSASDISPLDNAGLNYSWSFGDGTPSVNTVTPSVFHTYTAVGTYTATLTVVDLSGATASSTAVVTINPPVGGPLAGDVNLDGQVDLADYALLTNSLGLSLGDPGFAAVSTGDLNNNGTIDFPDLQLWNQIFQNQ